MPDAAAPRADIVVGMAGQPDAAAIAAVARAVRGVGGEGGAGPVLSIVVAQGPAAGAAVDPAKARAAVDCEVVTVTVAAPVQGDLPYHGLLGRVGAIRAVLAAAREREAPVAAFIGTGLDTFPAAWIPRLVAPAGTDGIDYVSPYYLRAPHEGAITRSIVYPVFRAMYGQRIRQPAAGEFGASARLQAHLLAQGFWDADRADTGIDLWLATAAVTGGFRVGEAAFGVRPTGPRIVTPDLSVTLAQVVGALFADMEARADVWQRVRGSTPVPVSGTAEPATFAAPELDLTRLIESFQLGHAALRDVWAWVVPPKTMLLLKRARR